MATNKNEKIITVLRALAEQYTLTKEEQEIRAKQKIKELEMKNFRAVAYNKAADAVSLYPVEITSGQQALKIQNIGPKISQVIQEIITTGTTKLLN